MEKSTKILIGGGVIVALLLLFKKKKPKSEPVISPSLPTQGGQIPIVTEEDTPIVYPTTPLFNTVDIPFDAPLNVPVFTPDSNITIDSALIPNTYVQEQPIVTPPTPIISPTTPIPDSNPKQSTLSGYYTSPIFTPIVSTPTFSTTSTAPAPTPTERSILIRASVTDIYSNPYSFQTTSPISTPITLYYSKNSGPKISLGIVTSTYCTQHSVVYAKDNDVITFSTDTNRNVIAMLGSSCPSPSYGLSSGMNSVKIINGQNQIGLTIQ